MNAEDKPATGAVLDPVRDASGAAVPARGLTVRQRRQVGWITLAALAVFAVLRWLPTGTNLSHMDFRVNAKNSIDFCDPLNPQFIPVVAVPSPVQMKLPHAPANAGAEVLAAVILTTASGKAIEPADLLVVHTARLHLLIADPTLTDYQHVHPVPGSAPGEWRFRFTPRFGGQYRVFADFTPAATNRGLYASADLEVARSRTEGAGSTGREVKDVGAALRRDSRAETDRGAEPLPSHVVVRDGYRFRLLPAQTQLQARVPVELKFTVENIDGGPVPMRSVMGAFAHLVAFDAARSGFAHLHPLQLDLARPPDAVHPTLDFKITMPKPGRYVIWAQVNLGGREVFAPFWFDVME